MSRIISILDAFDIMTHQQNSKLAMLTDEALHELHLKDGTQFDPALVQLFIRMMNEKSGMEKMATQKKEE
ncbi:MAG: hypothetical protein PHS72_08060 [Lachnospiraceae bacterium]|nr:hypothetical protein [Lachnospiraceae bacterium]